MFKIYYNGKKRWEEAINTILNTNVDVKHMTLATGI
jgi:hypothetical protein